MKSFFANEEEIVEIPEFDLIQFFLSTDQYGIYYWIYYIVIYIFLAFIYNKVFRVGRLTLIKNILVYVIIAIGAFVLLILQMDANLKIIESLGVAVILMLMVWIRKIWIQRKNKKDQQPSE